MTKWSWKLMLNQKLTCLKPRALLVSYYYLELINNIICRISFISRRCPNTSLWASKQEIWNYITASISAWSSRKWHFWSQLFCDPTHREREVAICYQLVALQTKQLVLVFTPTTALMQDQVKQLQSKDIPAIVLGDNGESIEALLMYYNQPLIAYLTLEYLFGPSSARRLHILKQLANTRQLALIAIDEAHLLFEWEHFR